MAFTIFYAWQSDIDESLCKDLIRTALDKAATELTQELGIEIVIDQDTQDVPGSPSIPETILQKIKASEAVVADLTLTHTSDKQVDPKKRGSNPNVMLEYGYALRASDRNIIGVINTAFGEVEELSFDLRHKRCITYSAFTDVDESGRKQVQGDLAKNLATEIRTIVKASGTPNATEKAIRARSRKRPSATTGALAEVPQQRATGTGGSPGNSKLAKLASQVRNDVERMAKPGERWTVSDGPKISVTMYNPKDATSGRGQVIHTTNRDDLRSTMDSLRSYWAGRAREDEEYAKSLLEE